ncbi:MAG TPA: hypothetical protein VNT51_01970 [Miltoncostaeaceae bacterium]|nr:hypothetical protein [Miltoncostaeaceae bacterium]
MSKGGRSGAEESRREPAGRPPEAGRGTSGHEPQDSRGEGGPSDRPEASDQQAGTGVYPQNRALGREGGRWLSPLFSAEHAPRYQRQELIREYEAAHGCRLVVVVDILLEDSIVLFEELLFDADPSQDLHVLIDSPGGDGETAVRMARAAQQRCRELVAVVPNQAKSAATIFAMGAHRIVMGPTSDLGPVDPQVEVAGSWVAAKDLIGAVDKAYSDVEQRPETYPIHATLLADVNAILVEQARSALARTEDLVLEALSSNPDRKPDEVAEIQRKAKDPLIDKPQSHAAIIGPDAAALAGLTIDRWDPQSDAWRLLWALYTRYVSLGAGPRYRVYEARRASQVLPTQ